MKAKHKKIIKNVGIVIVCVLAAMVLTSVGIWIYNGETSWTKPWERGELALMFYFLGTIMSVAVGSCTESNYKEKEFVNTNPKQRPPRAWPPPACDRSIVNSVATNQCLDSSSVERR